MDTAVLKKFAQAARRQLIEQIAAKLEFVLHTDSAELRGKEKALDDLKALIASTSEQVVVDRVAYVWFNRFCALRFMDVNRYTRIGTVSPAEGFTQPEILQEAKQGYFDDGIERFVDKQRVLDLLGNRTASDDPQQEAYKLLLVAVCNYYHASMPFLFEKIEDYTELLMPDDLLSENSVLQATREAIEVGSGERQVGSGKWEVGSEGASSHSPLHTSHSSNSLEVEVVGWLYQYYISEKKDEVFAGLKRNEKVTSEDIPAATQLFTPHWIVRYLVENSLGRLWMLNHPDSKLIEQMAYYIPEVKSEKWEVGSEGDHHGGEKLSGTYCLAEGDGSGDVDLPSNQDVSQGRALQPDQSGAESSGVDSVQYSRRASEEINSGVQEFSIHSPRIQSGSGNSNHDSATVGLYITSAGSKNSQPVGGDQTDDLRTNGKASLTSHSPLSTPHLRISSPEEIRIIDPACGSGHMLTYAFDLLHSIYEEQGYETREIPRLILENNLFGVEIDERAGELAAFALVMKACEKYKRFLRKPVQPRICVLEGIKFTQDELDAVGSEQWVVDSGVPVAQLEHDLCLFRDASNFGSLLRPKLTAEQLSELTAHYPLSTSHSLFEYKIHQKVLEALKQAAYLSQKYHVVIANPPYMGGKGMNPALKKFAGQAYPDSKSDLFAMFIERGFDMVLVDGYSAMVTMQSWMFLSSYEKLRSRLLNEVTIECMAHMANMVMGIAFGTAATVWRKKYMHGYRGAFCFIEYEDIGDGNKPVEFPPKNERNMAALRQRDSI